MASPRACSLHPVERRACLGSSLRRRRTAPNEMAGLRNRGIYGSVSSVATSRSLRTPHESEIATTFQAMPSSANKNGSIGTCPSAPDTVKQKVHQLAVSNAHEKAAAVVSATARAALERGACCGRRRLALLARSTVAKQIRGHRHHWARSRRCSRIRPRKRRTTRVRRSSSPNFNYTNNVPPRPPRRGYEPRFRFRAGQLRSLVSMRYALIMSRLTTAV